jgi:hypothetical protein
MKRSTQVALHFAATAVLYSVGCVAMLFDSSFAYVAWAGGFLLSMGSKELHRSIPSNEMWQVPAVIVLILALVFLPRVFLSPSATEEFKRFAFHPLVITALWALLMRAAYAQWRRELRRVDA